MPHLEFANCRIRGIACTVPRSEVLTSELAGRHGANAARIESLTGIRSRRVAPSHLCASDMCADAASRLLSELGWSRDSVDAVIFVSQSQDYFLPATACLLQHRLGLPKGCACIDVSLGCSGYVYGLATTYGLVEAGLRRALLLVGDTSSRRISEEDRSVCFLFGDSGTATAIERDPCRSTFVLATDGSGADRLIIPAGHSRHPVPPTACERSAGPDGNRRGPHELFMDGPEVMAFTMREVPPLLESLLTSSGQHRDAIDLLVLHQANRFVTDQLALRLGVPSHRVPSSVERFGNTSCASVPVTLAECCRPSLMSSGRCVAILGFGVGWSWGGCLTHVGPICMPDIGELD